MSEQTIPIPGRLKNVAIGGHVTGSEDIDAGEGKTQKQVNDETNDTLALHQSEISGLNSQNYVSVSSYSSLPATGSADTIYRVSSWDGNANSGEGAYDVTKYTQYAWNGTAYIVVSVKTQIGEVFDISEYKAVGGTLATFEGLSAALDNGNNVPAGIRKGGMSVKFVQSSDNKYIRYNLLATSFTTDITQWSIDDAGVYVDNPEFVEAKTDNDGKLLEARKADGTKVEYCDLEVKGGILNDSIQQQIQLKANSLDVINALATKVDKVIGKSLIDADYASSQKTIENPEWMQITKDEEDRILGGRKNDGTLVENVGIETEKIDTKRLTAEEANINVLNLTENGLNKLEQDLIEDGFNPSSDDVVKSISVAGNALPKNLNDVELPIASISQYGLMSPQDKAWIGSLQPSINITGSGVTKNAASFGFLPTSTAAANDTAIASALNGGGTILVDVPGIYDISTPITISSNTTLIFGANTFVRLQANTYAVINAGAYTRVYDENITLIGLHLIANYHIVPSYDITEGASNNGIIYGLGGYVSFFYVKRLHISDYVFTDLGITGYGANICTFEDVVIEKVFIKGEKDGLHFGRGKRLTVRDCKFACYDDACTLNAVDYSRSQPEVGWIEDVCIENCYDLVNPSHQSAGFFSRFMGGAWADWEQGCEVILSSTVIVEENGVKRMYRVAGGFSSGPDMRAWKFISTTKPSHTTVGSIVWLDEQQVTRTIDGVTETATMKIPWVLQQTQDVGYDGGVKNVIIKNIHLQKYRTFCIHYHYDNQWLNAIVPNAKGTSVIDNITFDKIIQEYEGVASNQISFLSVNCPINNIKLLNCYIKHYSLINATKLNVEGLVYPEAVVTIAGNTFTRENQIYLTSFGTGENNIPNRIRLYGNILKDVNALVLQNGSNFVKEDII